MKHETKRVRKSPTKCQLILSDEYRDRHGYATKQTWRPSCANQCGCQVPSSPTDPSIQNMVRMIGDAWLPFQSLTPSHRSEGCMDIARSRRDTSDRLLGRLLDAHPIATFLIFFQVMSTHLSSEFTQKSTFVMAADQQARQRLRVPRTPLHSTIHRLCEILDMRF